MDSEVLISHAKTLIRILKARGSCRPVLTRSSQSPSPAGFYVLASLPSLLQIPDINSRNDSFGFTFLKISVHCHLDLLSLKDRTIP